MSRLTKWLSGKVPGHGPLVWPGCIARIEFNKPEINIGLVESRTNGSKPVRSLSLSIEQDGVQAEVPITLELVEELVSAAAWQRGERD